MVTAQHRLRTDCHRLWSLTLPARPCPSPADLACSYRALLGFSRPNVQQSPVLCLSKLLFLNTATVLLPELTYLTLTLSFTILCSITVAAYHDPHIFISTMNELWSMIWQWYIVHIMLFSTERTNMATVQLTHNSLTFSPKPVQYVTCTLCCHGNSTGRLSLLDHRQAIMGWVSPKQTN